MWQSASEVGPAGPGRLQPTPLVRGQLQRWERAALFTGTMPPTESLPLPIGGGGVSVMAVGFTDRHLTQRRGIDAQTCSSGL